MTHFKNSLDFNYFETGLMIIQFGQFIYEYLRLAKQKNKKLCKISVKIKFIKFLYSVFFSLHAMKTLTAQYPTCGTLVRLELQKRILYI